MEENIKFSGKLIEYFQISQICNLNHKQIQGPRQP